MILSFRLYSQGHLKFESIDSHTLSWCLYFLDENGSISLPWGHCEFPWRLSFLCLSFWFPSCILFNHRRRSERSMMITGKNHSGLFLGESSLFTLNILYRILSVSSYTLLSKFELSLANFSSVRWRNRQVVSIRVKLCINLQTLLEFEHSLNDYFVLKRETWSTCISVLLCQCVMR